MPDSNATTDVREEPPKFEERLGELQTIVSDLESGSLGLDEAMQQFERGVTLLRTCFETLEQAEQRIEVLTGFDSAKRPRTVPFDAAPTANAEVQSAPTKPIEQPRDAVRESDNVHRSDNRDGDLLF